MYVVAVPVVRTVGEEEVVLIAWLIRQDLLVLNALLVEVRHHPGYFLSHRFYAPLKKYRVFGSLPSFLIDKVSFAEMDTTHFE